MTPTAQEVREVLIYAIAQLTTKEDFLEARKAIENMPEEELMKIPSIAKNYAPKSAAEEKEMFDGIRRFHKENGITHENSALFEVKLGRLDKKTNDIFTNEINRSNPTDRICVTKEEDIKLIELWNPDGKAKGIPSDLFFAKQIPLTDVEIEVDETASGGLKVSYRVLIVPDYQDIIDKVSKGVSEDKDAEKTFPIGCILMPVKNGTIIYPIILTYGLDFIEMSTEAGFYNVPESLADSFIRSSSLGMLSYHLGSYLQTWYGIQIALLHPEVRKVFQEPDTVRNYSSLISQNHPHKKKKITYIKKHVIKSKELDRRMYGEDNRDGKTKRQTLLWHVLGHWRTYQSGKKVFIQPYWKGPLREVKKLEEAREREINIPK